MSERESTRGGVNDTVLELEFTLGVVIGVLIFAVGFAFSILAISVDTKPPAPYFKNFTDRVIVGAFAFGLVIIGVGIVRWAASQVGW